MAAFLARGVELGHGIASAATLQSARHPPMLADRLPATACKSLAWLPLAPTLWLAVAEKQHVHFKSATDSKRSTMLSALRTLSRSLPCAGYGSQRYHALVTCWRKRRINGLVSGCAFAWDHHFRAAGDTRNF